MVRLTMAREQALRKMLAEYGKTPAETLSDLLAFSLDEDGATAGVTQGRLGPTLRRVGSYCWRNRSWYRSAARATSRAPVDPMTFSQIWPV